MKDDFKKAKPDIIGSEIYTLIKKLYPICRSITGDGVRKTLSIIQEYIPLKIHELPTGTPVYDWTVPKEWNIKDAYIKNAKGERVIDFNKSNLHVVNYSVPVKKKLPLEELKKNIFTLPDQPNWIPYRTSYYNETWGFCMAHNQLLQLEDGVYEVCIDSTLEKGHLTYGEYYLKGKIQDEILLFAHICHPSLCNDNLSGTALLTLMAEYLSKQSLRYSFRFVFAPATIGSITWLSINEPNLKKIKNGLVVACVGDPGRLTYKKSRRGNAEIDLASVYALTTQDKNNNILEFIPYGYDERQFCSQGIDLPMGRFTRSHEGGYPEYHTSADNMDFVRPVYLGDSFISILTVLSILENNLTYQNLMPKCEPQLGKRGLYRKTGGHQDVGRFQLAMLWVLNLSDGEHSLLDISRQSGLEFDLINKAGDELFQCGLLSLPNNPKDY